MDRVTWPGRILAGGGFFLWLALLPTVGSGSYPPATTSGLTAVVLAAFAAAQLRLRLRATAAVTALTAVTWGVLCASAV